jgi:Aspartyl protease/PDZ domain
MKRRTFFATPVLASALGTVGCADNSPRADAGPNGQAEVPMSVEDDAWTVEVLLQRRRLRFLLDTGADHSVVTPATAQTLGLALSDERVPGSGGGGPIDPVPWTVLDELWLGPARLRNELAFVIPVPPEFVYDGVLGAGFFGAFVARLDPAAGRLRLTLPERHNPSSDGHTLPLRLAGGGKMLVQAEAAGVQGWFSVDTGAIGNTLTFFTPTVERYALRSTLQPLVRMARGVSVSGVEYADIARASELAIGPWRLQRPVLDLAVARAGLFGSDGWQGNIGNAVWRRFVMTLNLGRGWLSLQANDQLLAPFVAPQSGLAARPAAEGFSVIDVVPGGPAAQAGVQPGDTLIALNGKLLAPSQWQLLRRAWLQPAGTSVQLRLRSPTGAQRDTTLVLRELV